MDDFASVINDQLKQLKEAVRKRGRVNLLVAGKTGVIDFVADLLGLNRNLRSRGPFEMAIMPIGAYRPWADNVSRECQAVRSRRNVKSFKRKCRQVAWARIALPTLRLLLAIWSAATLCNGAAFATYPAESRSTS